MEPTGKRLRTLIAIVPFVACLSGAGAQPSALDRLAIEVTGRSREFIYTNKESAFFYGETNARNEPGWQGFTVWGFRFVDEYDLLIDGNPLPRSTAIKTTVYPDYLERSYPGGITEQLRPVDGASLIAVIVTSSHPVAVGIAPWFSDERTPAGFTIRLGEGYALIARKRHPARTQGENFPVWLAIQGSGFLPERREAMRGREFSPVVLTHGKSKTHMVAFAVGENEDEALALARGYAARASQYFRSRRARMERLLAQTLIQTHNARFDKAIAWAKLSLDALVMNQGERGIFAGLPWFNDYWGRDTFISLPGAALVTGRFALARELLRSFAGFQQTDITSTDYGRIPNIVTTTSKAYNTADGTPRFVIMARDYVERSGDSTFLLEVYPTVLRSIEGTIAYHTDSLGFLVHGDAETWMDAAGPDGPWSPRGNRANDIQALWARQLEAGEWFATRVGDVISARSWHAMARKVRSNFGRYFVSDGIISDHLRKDGSRDRQLRPNQIFDAPILDERTRAQVARIVTNQLTYSYGVASLSQDDPDFHPFHIYPQCYPKDAAYHNGVVWTWLQGPLISELCHFARQESAYPLTANSVHQILDRGAVGTQSELLDAVPRQGESEPRLSGTCSQAWNLAEFIRNFYEDYIGVRFDQLAHRITIAPHLPSSFGAVRAIINSDGTALPIAIDQHGENPSVAIDARNLRTTTGADIQLRLSNARSITSHFALQPRSTFRLEYSNGIIRVTRNGRPWTNRSTLESPANEDSLLLPLGFALPLIHPGLRSMRGPGYPLLSLAEIKEVNPRAPLLADLVDPAGDDSGTGRFTYPSNPVFAPGIFDIVRFTVRRDSALAYFTLRFRALTDPGWHPEYGFQLTYAAIAIDEDGVRGSGSLNVGHNANYRLDSARAFERLILVGGGVRVEDSRGTILAAYVPGDSDATNPLGNIQTATISFSVPLTFLGAPSPAWRFTVLTGAQDDHGGSGLGEFRTVNGEAGEWNGGGRHHPEDPNVYDVVATP